MSVGTVVTLIAFWVYSLLFVVARAFDVSEYRSRLVTRLIKIIREDTKQGKDFVWRMKKFDEVTYEEMIFKFWRPVDSFYKDKSFLKE